MSLWGTLIGGTLGWTLGGPLGAMLGAAVGSSLGGRARAETMHGPRPAHPRGPRPFAAPPPPPADRAEERRVAFFVATFGVMGHIAKADGRVSEEEVALAREVMAGLGLDSRDRNLAVRIFNEGKSPRFDLDEALGQLARVAGRRRNLLRAFVEIQFKAAWADGSVHPEERRILDHIGALLGFSVHEMAQMERVATAGFADRRRESPEEKLKEAYGVLGADRSASDEDIRSAYRRLMRQHHPDRLAAQGLPEEMKAEATRRTQEIQKAYQTVREARRAA